MRTTIEQSTGRQRGGFYCSGLSGQFFQGTENLQSDKQDQNKAEWNLKKYRHLNRLQTFITKENLKLQLQVLMVWEAKKRM